MSQQGAHSYEDKLLEFAYGELPSTEARSVEAHVKGCARCAGALASIRGVRRTMATLEPEPAPDAGLDSLLAYANQAARRIQAGPAPSSTRWRRWIFSLAGVASLAILGVVATRVAELTKTPAAQIDEALREQRAEQKAAPAPEPAPATAAVDVPAQATPQPVAQAHDEGQAGTEGRADKLPMNAMDLMEGGKGTFPSAGAQAERKGAAIGSGPVANKSVNAYVPPAGSAGLDRRDYTQRIAKPTEPPAKKRAAAKSDLDSSGWGDARLQNRAGGGSPGGDTLDDLPQVEERKEAELAKEAARGKSEEEPRRLSLSPKDAFAESAPARDDSADAESADDVAPNGPATTKAPEVSRREVAQAEPVPQQISTSISTGTRQRSSTEAAAPATAAAMPLESYQGERASQDRSDALLRSRQEKLRAQIDSTREQSKLIDLYSQLCEVEIDLGLYQPASCQHIVQTFPGMNAAKLARNLLEAQRQRVLEQRVLEQEKAAKSKVIRSDDAARDVRQ